ncbi:MAG: beta-lactamase family protein [Bacteroidetes bacterium]|nr:beta-lactamase family protein [Bacteroidota bacterium]MBS1631763.1 beta-lactamase family protein [Bacteroidota bacterium]
MRRIFIFVPLLFFSSLLMSQQRIASRIDSLLPSSLKKDEPGGAVLIAKGDKILFSKGYGIADINTREPITSHTIFNTGSVSKTFVSNAILILEQRKVLSLDDNLAKYFPEIKNKEIGQKVKIRHLLSHVSGLPDNRKVSENPVFYLTADDVQNFQPVLQTDTLNFEPGNRYEYSNPAFNGLALIIEKITGSKWQDFVRKEIFAPAGMTESDITDGAHPESGVAHGYERVNGKYDELDYGEEPTFCAAGNGGIWCSVTDLYKYYLALQKPAFLNADIIANSMEIKKFKNWNSSLKPNIGYSWFVTKTINGLKRIGHTGSQGGFRADFEFVPEKKIVICLLFNNSIQNASSLTKDIEKILVEEKLL